MESTETALNDQRTSNAPAKSPVTTTAAAVEEKPGRPKPFLAESSSDVDGDDATASIASFLDEQRTPVLSAPFAILSLLVIPAAVVAGLLMVPVRGLGDFSTSSINGVSAAMWGFLVHGVTTGVANVSILLLASLFLDRVFADVSLLAAWMVGGMLGVGLLDSLLYDLPFSWIWCAVAILALLAAFILVVFAQRPRRYGQSRVGSGIEGGESRTNEDGVSDEAGIPSSASLSFWYRYLDIWETAGTVAVFVLLNLLGSAAVHMYPLSTDDRLVVALLWVPALYIPTQALTAVCGRIDREYFAGGDDRKSTALRSFATWSARLFQCVFVHSLLHLLDDAARMVLLIVEQALVLLYFVVWMELFAPRRQLLRNCASSLPSLRVWINDLWPDVEQPEFRAMGARNAFWLLMAQLYSVGALLLQSYLLRQSGANASLYGIGRMSETAYAQLQSFLLLLLAVQAGTALVLWLWFRVRHGVNYLDHGARELRSWRCFALALAMALIISSSSWFPQLQRGNEFVRFAEQISA